MPCPVAPGTPTGPIVDHTKFRWPGGAGVAVWIIPNVEHYPWGLPGIPVNERSSTADPDVLNYSWRDYGPRVGIWRLFDCLGELAVPVSATLNSDVCDEYPQLVEEGCRRGWEWIGHGTNNSTRLSGLTEDQESELVHTALERIASATGRRPRGWLGPGLVESHRTPDILRAAGIEYVCDWLADDLPFPLTVQDGELLCLPYSIELNDTELLLRQHLTGRAVPSTTHRPVRAVVPGQRRGMAWAGSWRFRCIPSSPVKRTGSATSMKR